MSDDGPARRAGRLFVRRGFGPLFVVTGALHFVMPRVYLAIVPHFLPERMALVYASGVAEIVGGAGLLHARTRRPAAWLSIATLVAVFPANVYMAMHPSRYRVPGGAVSLWLRLPLQAALIAWAAAGARPARSQARSTPRSDLR